MVRYLSRKFSDQIIGNSTQDKVLTAKIISSFRKERGVIEKRWLARWPNIGRAASWLQQSQVTWVAVAGLLGARSIKVASFPSEHLEHMNSYCI